MIFETERLLIRKLTIADFKGFNELEGNPLVLKYATGNVKTAAENKTALKELIAKYNKPKNDFWIYAIERKLDTNFIGTVALVKDVVDDEIGYRFLEKYWKKGYATEACLSLLSYCKQLGMPKLVGYVVHKNIASVKILEGLNFKAVKHFISDDIQLPETKYEIIL